MLFRKTIYPFVCFLLLLLYAADTAAARASGEVILQSSGVHTKKDSLSSVEFIHLYGYLDNFFSRVKRQSSVTIAFLGGSITAGSGWRDRVMDYLQETYPQTQWSFINAGIPSLGSLPHAFRLERDVLAHGRVDLLFIESAVNDLVNGTPAATQRRALEGIVRHARMHQPQVDIVLMAFADEDKLADYSKGVEPEEIKIHDEVARYYKLPFINLAREVFKRIEDGEFTWKDDFIDLHPSPFGHRLYFRTIRTLFEACEVRSPKATKRSSKLPAPVDRDNYSRGKYVSVRDAVSLKGFQFDPSWMPADHQSRSVDGSPTSGQTRPAIGTRKGFVEVPMLVGEEAGSSFEFTFQGSAVGIAVVSGPDAGVIRYSIDGGDEIRRDLYTQWSKSLHLPWYLMLSDGLGVGRHTLRVTIEDSPTGRTACRVVHFLVNSK